MRSQARLEKVLRRIARDLDEIGARFALIGGLAVSARTGPRFTRDADLAVAVPDDRAAEKLLGSLRHHGYEIESLVEHDAVGRMATARLVPPGEIQEGVIVDLLFASSGVEREIVREADDIEILRGLRIKVATIPHLLAMKILSRDDATRPQDAADLAALRKRCTPQDLQAVRGLLQLISERGFARGKDLLAELDRLPS